MEHREGSFSSLQGTNICHQCWLPGDEPRAILLIVHGLGEHIGRYTNVVDHLCPLGYALYGLDHIGHGKSDGDPLHVNRFADYIVPLETYAAMVRQEYPQIPVFLFAHSLGGLIGAYYLLDHQDELAGAILSGPLATVPENVSPATVLIGKLLSALVPKMGLMPSADPQGVSSDPKVVEAYIEDPLVSIGKITARLAHEMLKAMQRVQAEASSIALPVLIIQGSDDKLIGTAGAHALFNSIRSSDKTLSIYEGFYHETYNEPGRAQVLSDIEAWLEEHT